MSTVPPWVLRGAFLAYLAPLLLAIALLTPPWQNPDEPFHMLRAVQVAHGGLIGYRAWGSAGGDSDPAIYDAYKPIMSVAMHPDRRIARDALAASEAVGWRRGTIYTPFPNTAQYSPVFYVPDAAAYWIGRAAGLPIDRTLLLARAANAMLFALGATLALSLAHRARPLLAAILLLPTSLALAASASQDSLLLICVALAVALLDRAIAGQRAATRNALLLIAALLTACAVARPPYAGFLLLLWPGAAFGQRAPARLMLACFGIVAAWCAVVAWHVSIKLGGSDIDRQMALLSGDPARILSIVAATARRFGVEYGVQVIGVLGWTDTRLPRWYIVGAGLVLVLAGAAASVGAGRRGWVALAAAGFAVVAIFVLQYLTWTWPGQPYVTGVLGRYFVPVAMVLALALPRLGQPARLRGAAFVAIAVQACVTPAVMLHALVWRYYTNPG